MRVTQRRVMGCALLHVLLVAPALRGDDWPGFMGRRGDGVSAETGVFTAGRGRLEVAWKRPLGSAYSGISVAGGRAVTIFSDGESDVVIALAASDGREQWRYVLGPTYKGHDGSQDGALATPLIADGKVFALGPRGRLAALEAATGKELWAVELVAQHEAVKPHWGFGTSPLIAEGVLVVQGGARGALCSGFDPQHGKLLWSAGQDTVNYQTPVLFTWNERAAILAAGDAQLACIEPKSGQVLWSQPHEGGGERGATCVVPLALDSSRVFLKHLDDRSKLVTIAMKDGGAVMSAAWESPSIGKTFSPAVHHAGYLYGYNNRNLACVEAASGKLAWRSREPGDGFVIVADGHLIVATKDGGIHVAKLNPRRYEEVAGLKVFDGGLCWCPPSFADGSIYVRSMDAIARVEARSGGAADQARDKPSADAELAGTEFDRFLQALSAADDRKSAIDRFLEDRGETGRERFPLIEPDGRVIFIYRGPAEDVVLGGDVTGFGAKKPLKRVADTDLFYCVVRLEPDARLNYGFICDYKAGPDPLNPRRISAPGFDDDLEMVFDGTATEVSWLAMPLWSPPKHIEPAEESRRGRIESLTLTSEALKTDVAIDVYLPAGYEKSDGPLPVLFVHDGRTARGELHLVETLDNLIDREIPPVVAVFIMHPPPFFGPQEAYAKMAAGELPRLIDEKYRTARGREGRGHFGTGFAAMSAAYAVLAHPESGSRVAILSPFAVGPGPLAAVMKKSGEAPLRIYLGWCKYDLRSELEGWSMAKSGRELEQFFRQHGYEPAGGEANDGSGVASWQNRTDDALRALFPISQ